MIESGAWIIILESLVALAMAVLIVWWTVPRQTPEPTEAAAPEHDSVAEASASRRDSSAE